MTKFNSSNIGGIEELRQFLDQYLFNKSLSYKSKLIGLVITTIGLASFFQPFQISIKISATIVLIGIFMVFLIMEKSTIISIDVKITVFIISWILLMLYFTRGLNIDTFFILIVLGILIIKELMDEFITIHLRKRLNLLISLFLVIYIVYIGEKIISFLNI